MDSFVKLMPKAAAVTPVPTPNQPYILECLPHVIPQDKPFPLRAQQDIDLMLLALEALQTGGSEQMLAAAQRLGLTSIIKNRVVFWRLRCRNPLRRSHKRAPLTPQQGKALVVILGEVAKQKTVVIRQLLLAEQQMRRKHLPLRNHFLLGQYLELFRSHFRSRMNPRRARVANYLAHPDHIDQLAINLLNRLLFCTGTAGIQRFWISLFDGEVK